MAGESITDDDVPVPVFVAATSKTSAFVSLPPLNWSAVVEVDALVVQDMLICLAAPVTATP